MRYLEIETSEDGSAIIKLENIIAVCSSGTSIQITYPEKEISLIFTSRISTVQASKNRSIEYNKIKKFLEKL